MAPQAQRVCTNPSGAINVLILQGFVESKNRVGAALGLAAVRDHPIASSSLPLGILAARQVAIIFGFSEINLLESPSRQVFWRTIAGSEKNACSNRSPEPVQMMH